MSYTSTPRPLPLRHCLTVPVAVAEDTGRAVDPGCPPADAAPPAALRAHRRQAASALAASLDVPTGPALPLVPDRPATLAAPDLPAVPVVPIVSDRPASLAVPAVPDLSAVPDLPTVPALPAVPASPATAAATTDSRGQARRRAEHAAPSPARGAMPDPLRTAPTAPNPAPEPPTSTEARASVGPMLAANASPPVPFSRTPRPGPASAAPPASAGPTPPAAPVAPVAPVALARRPVPGVAYELSPGDTLAAVAHTHALDLDALLDANGLARTSILYVGERILLPTLIAGGSRPLAASV